MIRMMAVAAVLAAPALAHDENHWWRSLRTPDNSTTCCNESDCTFTEARITGNRWQALYRGAWIDIPDGAVLRIPNPYGEPTLCVWNNRVLCLVPGSVT